MPCSRQHDVGDFVMEACQNRFVRWTTWKAIRFHFMGEHGLTRDATRTQLVAAHRSGRIAHIGTGTGAKWTVTE